MNRYPVPLGEYETLNEILNGRSIARYGDGEFNLVRGRKCVPQLYSHQIQNELREILRKPGKCLVGIPYTPEGMPADKAGSWAKWMPSYQPFYNPKVEYGSAFITRPDSAPWINHPAYFKQMAQLWVGQRVTLVYGGRRSLYPEFLRAMGALVDPVLCSYEDGYAQIDYLMKLVRRAGNQRVILCAGPAATCMAHRLDAEGFHALDLGHIGLFWPEAKSLVAPVPRSAVPPVSATKAAIKAYGALREAPVDGWVWPACDPHPLSSIAKEKADADSMSRHTERAVVVIGAGGGPFIERIAHRYEMIYAFEPNMGLFGALRRNIHRLGIQNVMIYKDAFGAKTEIVNFDPSYPWRVSPTGTVPVLQVNEASLELPEPPHILQRAR